MSAIDDLLGSIFDRVIPAFYPEFERWVCGSRRFKEFATEYRNKIRSKLKNLRTEESLNDVRAELQTAALLLQEKRFTLEYEKYAATKQRGPDFTVTFKAHTPFNVEVRRVREIEMETVHTNEHSDKLIAILCEKVRQMPPSMINLLWLTDECGIPEDALTDVMVMLRERAEHKDEDFFTRHRFSRASEFLKHFQQLSGVVLYQPDETILWLNALAKHKVPSDLVKTLQRLSFD